MDERVKKALALKLPNSGLHRIWRMRCDRALLGLSEKGCRNTEVIQILRGNDHGTYQSAMLMAYAKGWVNVGEPDKANALWLCKNCYRQFEYQGEVQENDEAASS